MFFWNINALVHKLKTLTLSSYEQTQYYLTLMLCTSLMGLVQLFPKNAPIDYSLYLWSWVAGLIVLICGVTYCYNLNKRGDNKDFLLRMITLQITGCIRLMLISLMIIIPLSLIVGIALGAGLLPATMFSNPEKAAIIGTGYGLAWAVLLYWYLGEQFKKIAYTTEHSVEQYH